MSTPPNILRPAVFFDRDGTLIRHVHYLTKPEEVALEDGAAQALIWLRQAGYLRIVVTNQPVIAKNLLTEQGLELVHEEMTRQFVAAGASVDRIYHCPLASISGDPTIVEFPDRKPGPGMLLRAAREMNIDLSQSWMIGDSINDILAGQNAGCRGSIWIGPKASLWPDVSCHRAANILAAAKVILGSQ